MNQKRLQRVATVLPVTVASLLIIVLMNACGGGGSANIPVPGRDQFSGTIANLTTLLGSGFNIAASAGGYLPSALQRASRRSQCPEVEYEYDEERGVHVVTERYDGCTDEFDIQHQGVIRVEIDFDDQTQICTNYYQDYDNGSGKMNGMMVFRLPDRNELTYEITTNYTLELAPGCVITVQNTGTLTTEEPDDVFGVFNGTGTMTIGSQTLTFTMTDVRTAENCIYPVGGASTFEIDGKTITLNYSETCGRGFIQTEGSNPEPIDLAELIRNFSPCE